MQALSLFCSQAACEMDSVAANVQLFINLH